MAVIVQVATDPEHPGYAMYFIRITEHAVQFVGERIGDKAALTVCTQRGCGGRMVAKDGAFKCAFCGIVDAPPDQEVVAKYREIKDWEYLRDRAWVEFDDFTGGFDIG